MNPRLGLIPIPLHQLHTISGELMLPPEVRSHAELEVLLALVESTVRMNESELWKFEYCREVDMTAKRKHFKSESTNATFPLLEGRMLHAFTSKGKEHVSGSGRSAKWVTNLNEERSYSELVQFHMTCAEIKPEARARIDTFRVAVRDIVGQTNERTMMAARIPGGVACGNKVPTLLFPYFSSDPGLSEQAQKVWICVANSFVFDWMARKFVTTSMNKFILEVLRFPKTLVPQSSEWNTLIDKYDALEFESSLSLRWGQIRGEIDALVAEVSGLELSEMREVLLSFPLLDKNEPPLQGEKKSSITMDTVLAEMGCRDAKERFEAAKVLGAIPYRPDAFMCNS